MKVAMVSGMRNDFVFVMPSFKRARGSEFQKNARRVLRQYFGARLQRSGIGRK
jgi:hypothetical protein